MSFIPRFRKYIETESYYVATSHLPSPFFDEFFLPCCTKQLYASNLARSYSFKTCITRL